METNLQSDETKALLDAYRNFEEFKRMSDEQILETDQFLRSYSELVYNSLSRLPQEAKVIRVDFAENDRKAA